MTSTLQWRLPLISAWQLLSSVEHRQANLQKTVLVISPKPKEILFRIFFYVRDSSITTSWIFFDIYSHIASRDTLNDGNTKYLAVFISQGLYIGTQCVSSMSHLFIIIINVICFVSPIMKIFYTSPITTKYLCTSMLDLKRSTLFNREAFFQSTLEDESRILEDTFAFKDGYL